MTERELLHKNKQELERGTELTRPGRTYKPDVDIYETDEAIVLVADIPGADPSAVDINVRDHRLVIEARINPDEYRDLKPVYTEYNVGPFQRAFELGEQIDQERIQARVADGVLSLTLPKVQKARLRKIPVSVN